MSTDTVQTTDGTCPVRLFTPHGAGPWPGVVMFPDAGGARDTFAEMAQRLADYGYAVLLPDVYYRAGAWAPFDLATAFTDPAERERVFALMGSLTPDRVAGDATVLFDYLESSPSVSGTRFGVCGYCMGGRMTMIVAGRVPSRVATAASFHGGGLVTDGNDSPHLLADRITATVYLGAAENDASFTAANSRTLEAALAAAGVEHQLTWYAAPHGFAVPDNPSYDAEAARRHWDALTAVFATTLPG